MFKLLRQVMKRVTITMEQCVLEWARIKAARENVSVSRYLGNLVEQARTRDTMYERAMRAALKFKPLPFSKQIRYLDRDDARCRADVR